MESEETFTSQPTGMASGGAGEPLQQMSQGRFNQLRLPQSPSTPTYLHEHLESLSRRGSDLSVAADVKSKIAFLNNLATTHNGSANINTNSFAIASSPTRSPIKSAFSSPTKTLSRVNSVMSISMTSSKEDLASMIQALHAQLEQSRSRERLVAERVESMMEQLQSAHSRSRHEQKEGEREIKSMKRQVHKAELALIRCQQEIQEARNEQEGFKARAEYERQAKEKSRQEAFERARTLASLMEEIEVVKREKEVLVGENQALKAVQLSMESMREKEENVETSMQMESEKMAVDVQRNEDALASIPNRCSKCEDSDTLDQAAMDAELIQDLRDELMWAKSQVKKEQDTVHMMNMQCQFRSCPCRLAEKAGLRFVHDHAYDRRQQERAALKGLKRKAEDQLPLPAYKSLRTSLDQKTRVRVDDDARPPATERTTTPMNIQKSVKLTDTLGNTRNAHPAIVPGTLTHPDFQDAPKVREDLGNNQPPSAGVIALDEAAEIPLPSPRSDDLEPTAMLEDITQVMVEPEPAATANHFAFSTSSRKQVVAEPETPTWRQNQDIVPASSSGDLFDIRPARYLPPRPSTVMGLRTIASPIRMVPPSPEHHGSLTPSGSPPRSRTTQIPLKDSPLKNTVTHRRSNSRPPERPRARSPTPARGRFEANSPSVDTYFPVTPKQKSDRQNRPAILAQPASSAVLQTLASQSTTTTVPLRGGSEERDYEDNIDAGKWSKTMPLNIDMTRGRQPLHPNDPNTHSHSHSHSHSYSVSQSQSQNNMLPGTPITREAALAQIRARRDRARSVAMRKQEDGENGSVAVKTPKSAARRGVMLNRERDAIAMSRDISNLSQASAPARF